MSPNSAYEIISSEAPKEKTEAEELVDYLKKCSEFTRLIVEVYPVLIDLARKTDRSLEEVYAESDFLALSLEEVYAESDFLALSLEEYKEKAEQAGWRPDTNEGGKGS